MFPVVFLFQNDDEGTVTFAAESLLKQDWFTIPVGWFSDPDSITRNLQVDIQDETQLVCQLVTNLYLPEQYKYNTSQIHAPYK